MLLVKLCSFQIFLEEADKGSGLDEKTLVEHVYTKERKYHSTFLNSEPFYF